MIRNTNLLARDCCVLTFSRILRWLPTAIRGTPFCFGADGSLSLSLLISLSSWFGFSKKTGLSPLAPGQWKGFLAVYAGFYVFNNFVRPMRFAASVGVAPYFDRIVKSIQRRTKLGKAASIGIVVFLANIVGTTSLMSLGIYIASLAAGIPIFPPKA